MRRFLLWYSEYYKVDLARGFTPTRQDPPPSVLRATPAAVLKSRVQHQCGYQGSVLTDTIHPDRKEAYELKTLYNIIVASKKGRALRGRHRQL